ncbi:winged helix-turn-helix transcriptional regulator [Candidatus Uhrbacteria bacterium]|nr:winged helix-turn-helix transcriptional regulator [Candidatus Uhrbacteria bacterium]
MNSTSIQPSLTFVLALSRLHVIMSRKGFLSLGYSDFVILHYLAHAPEEKMRRIDLADRVGLTASGITRMLLPMEKIGLVERETHPTDARVSFVVLAKGGKRLYAESLESVELMAENITEGISVKELRLLEAVLRNAGDRL